MKRTNAGDDGGAQGKRKTKQRDPYISEAVETVLLVARHRGFSINRR